MTTPTPRPRRLSRKRSGPRTLTPRRAVVETTPGPRSEGDPRHLAMTVHGAKRAER